MTSKHDSNGVSNKDLRNKELVTKEKKNKPFLIGVSGGTGSGKSSVCKKIVEQLNINGELNQNVFVVSLDSFYKQLDEAESALAKKNLYNFDHPRAFDYELLRDTIMKMLAGECVEVFNYDHVNFTNIRTNPVKISKPGVVFIEGILVFYQEDIKSLFDMKLFVETDDDTRLARRVLRDIDSLGRSLEGILNQYVTYVKPAFEEFCLPTKKYADVIIPRGADNNVAVEVIAQHIKDILKTRSSSAPTEQQSDNGDIDNKQQVQQLQEQQQLQQQLQQQNQVLSRSNSTNNSTSPGSTLLSLRPH